jgi:hypothetical protein
MTDIKCAICEADLTADFTPDERAVMFSDTVVCRDCMALNPELDAQPWDTPLFKLSSGRGH